MSRKHGFGTLLTGALIGAGLGILFAPKEGSETRKELKNKMNNLMNQIKEIDYDEVKDHLMEKLDDLKAELKDLDKEKVLSVAKTKATQIKNKAEELIQVAKEKGTPVVEKAALEVKEKTIVVLKDVIERLEKGHEEEKELMPKPKKVATKK
ncbi:MAG: hypothetical protein HFI08_00580 [Bacilli bacterium]|jgi:gas vesicle protein|nr:hypothetical protein [Bacilli bacterium]